MAGAAIAQAPSWRYSAAMTFRIVRIVLAIILSAGCSGVAPLALASERLLLQLMDAEVDVDAYTGDPVVNIRLAKKSQARFAAFTADHIGQQIELVVNGMVVASPVIQGKIDSPNLQVSGLGETEATAEMATKLAGGQAMVEVRVAGE